MSLLLLLSLQEHGQCSHSGQTALEAASALDKDHEHLLRTKGEPTDSSPSWQGGDKWKMERGEKEAANPAELCSDKSSSTGSLYADNGWIANTDGENRKCGELEAMEAGMQEETGDDKKYCGKEEM